MDSSPTPPPAAPPSVDTPYRVIPPAAATGAHVKAWTRGVAVEAEAEAQLRRMAALPFVHGWIAAMPDVHLGKGATVGSVIPTVGAIVPAAVGVDIGCGMVAAETSLRASDLPSSLAPLRQAIERAVPHGRSHRGQSGLDEGAWRGKPNERVLDAWRRLGPGWRRIVDKHPNLARGKGPGGPEVEQLGTLGTGNHFIEVCLDERERVWLLLHSGSRGVGNRVGTYFIERAREEARRRGVTLDDADLAWLVEGTPAFTDYVEAVGWAQDYAATNRRLMLDAVIDAARRTLPPFTVEGAAVNCHHNYVAREHHFGQDVWLTRKGAVRAGRGELGIIPGSMGARSYITRGLGNADSFESSSHGAGRAMSRSEAKRRFTVEDHRRATAGIECRKDAAVVDETPAAYKPIEAVMAAQRDLVEVVHELKQVVCVKG